MDLSLGIEIRRRFYSLGKRTQQLQTASSRRNSAVLYQLHYVQKQFCLCLLRLWALFSLPVEIHLPQRWAYTKAKEQSTPSFGEVWTEFRGAFLSFFSLRGTGGQCSLFDAEFTCVQQSCLDRNRYVKGTCQKLQSGKHTMA